MASQLFRGTSVPIVTISQCHDRLYLWRFLPTKLFGPYIRIKLTPSYPISIYLWRGGRRTYWYWYRQVLERRTGEIHISMSQLLVTQPSEFDRRRSRSTPIAVLGHYIFIGCSHHMCFGRISAQRLKCQRGTPQLYRVSHVGSGAKRYLPVCSRSKAGDVLRSQPIKKGRLFQLHSERATRGHERLLK